MKKTLLSFILSALYIFNGCEKDFDTVIDQTPSSFQVTGLRLIDTVRFIPGDSLLLMTITYNDVRDLKSTYSDIYSSAGSKLNNSPVNLFDNGRPENGDQTAGDKTYSNKFPLSQANPNGLYTIRYFAQDENNNTKQVALQSFNYDNGQANLAPLISNDIIEPDTLVANTTVTIQVLIKAEDPNGLVDVESVYFTVFRPDGSSNNIKVDLFDSGNITAHGDLVQGDGIYSLKIQVDQTNMKGTYRFEFQARDRGKKLSNVINHPVLIQ